ncbi:MAG: hypothetical protein ACE5IF_01915 [Candidatus Bathyarchaeia archaeon]
MVTRETPKSFLQQETGSNPSYLEFYVFVLGLAFLGLLALAIVYRGRK